MKKIVLFLAILSFKLHGSENNTSSNNASSQERSRFGTSTPAEQDVLAKLWQQFDDEQQKNKPASPKVESFTKSDNK